MTGRVHDMILDPKLTGQLPEVIAEGGYYGMQTFDQHLLEHLQAGRITFDDAMRVATSPHDFKLMVAAQTKHGQPIGAQPAAPQPTDEPAPAPAAPAEPAVSGSARGSAGAARGPAGAARGSAGLLAAAGRAGVGAGLGPLGAAAAVGAAAGRHLLTRCAE